MLIINQLKILIIFFISGLVMSLIFDLFRVHRKIFKSGNISTYIQDVLFWMISGIIFICVDLKYANGEIRAYMIFGVILGVLLYFKFISSFFIRINMFIVTTIIGIFKFIINPFQKNYKIIKKNWKKNNNMV